MHFIDTNILLYSVSTARDEQRKREQSIAILDRDDGAISVQVLQEFYVQATRPTRAAPLSHDVAVGLIDTWFRFRVQDTTRDLMNNAFAIKAMYGLSYWDAAVIAAARTLGCNVLLTEGMNHGQIVDGVTITNPFR